MTQRFETARDCIILEVMQFCEMDYQRALKEAETMLKEGIKEISDKYEKEQSVKNVKQEVLPL